MKAQLCAMAAGALAMTLCAYGQAANRETPATGNTVWNGTLVDAECRDRTTFNLRQPASPASSTPLAAPNTGASSAAGVTVSAEALASQRGDIMDHQVADLRTRQSDSTCAITGNTRSFALLTDSGRLLNLDEGGNTFAIVAAQATEAGRAVLAGRGPGFKPRVTLEGRPQNDRLAATRLEITRNGQ